MSGKMLTHVSSKKAWMLFKLLSAVSGGNDRRRSRSTYSTVASVASPRSGSPAQIRKQSTSLGKSSANVVARNSTTTGCARHCARTTLRIAGSPTKPARRRVRRRRRSRKAELSFAPKSMHILTAHGSIGDRSSIRNHRLMKSASTISSSLSCSSGSAGKGRATSPARRSPPADRIADAPDHAHVCNTTAAAAMHNADGRRMAPSTARPPIAGPN
mmetsp:Transcript_49638/g.139743  ORF Transcript_49638/g.139743 Transcript_49638/m.139743 type:complete len:215 (-) Transcript_49638:50-694(-)